MQITLGPGVKIDLDKLVESRLLVQANSGGGKSWAIRRIVEQAFGKVQIIIIDPEGEFGNLRSQFDFIYVGKGGDAPAESRSAALLATRLLELKASAIIDLYELPPQERKHFVRLFCEAMVNAPKELWHDALVIVDEAHVFAPEKDQSEALGAIIDLASRGRKRGFCAVLATQRPAKLNKDAAAECNNKLIGRASLDIDRKRASEELGFSSKESILSLRDLSPGEFYAFGPAISREVIKTTIGDVHVKPAKRGVSRLAPPKPSAHVKQILSQLADLPKEAEQEAKTVSELKAKVRELERTKPTISVDIEEEVQKRLTTHVTAIETERNAWRIEMQHMDEYVDSLLAIIKNIGPFVEREIKTLIRPSGKPGATYKVPEKKVVAPAVVSRPVNISKASFEQMANGESKPLSKGARLVLTYLHNVYPAWKSKAQLWVAAGYAPGGGFNNLVYELTGAGLIEKDGAGKYASLERHTPDQIDPSFDASLLKWDSKLSLGARKVFHVLLESPDQAFSKEELASQTGYAMGWGFNNLFYELTGKELAVRVGTAYRVNEEVLDL